MRFILLCFVWPVVSVASLAGADDLEVVAGVEAQPLKAQAKRIEQVLQFLGEPLDATRQAELDAACHETDDAAATLKIQRILDPLCI
ncbi:MAG TPA: hypothetical protein PKD54_06805, partial [Pirellulaceae bacterium]|nr:hypothetical protein [Pirellulaceae bacterium]